MTHCFLGYSHTLNPSSCCLGLWRGNVLHFVWALSPKADFLLQKWMDQPSVFSSISSFVGRWIIFVDPVLRKECRLQTAEYGSPQWRNANQCHIFVIVIIVVFFPDVRLLLAVLVSHVTCSLDRQDNLHCIDIYIYREYIYIENIYIGIYIYIYLYIYNIDIPPWYQTHTSIALSPIPAITQPEVGLGCRCFGRRYSARWWS